MPSLPTLVGVRMERRGGGGLGRGGGGKKCVEECQNRKGGKSNVDCHPGKTAYLQKDQRRSCLSKDQFERGGGGKKNAQNRGGGKLRSPWNGSIG